MNDRRSMKHQFFLSEVRLQKSTFKVVLPEILFWKNDYQLTKYDDGLRGYTFQLKKCYKHTQKCEKNSEY